jgi:hypothetical protein
MRAMRKSAIRVLGYRATGSYVVIILPICLVIGISKLIGRHDWAGVAAGVACLVFFGRVAMMSIRVRDSGIVVTNLFRTYRIPWTSINCFRVSRLFRSPVVAIVRPDLSELKAGGTYVLAERYGISRAAYARENWICAELNAELKRRAPDSSGSPGLRITTGV